MTQQIHLVVMGVAGCGKSTIAAMLQQRLDWPKAEGDDFHPAENVTKMRSGVPLSDADRWGWLDLIVSWTARQAGAGQNTIVTCSALRRAYRDRLRTVPGRTIFLHLNGPEELLQQRISGREGHFMPASLLPSQLAILEPLQPDEDGLVVDLSARPDDLVEQAITSLKLSRDH